MGTMDELINPGVVRALTNSLTAASSSFSGRALGEVEGELQDQRLRDRVDLVRDALIADVPGGFADIWQLVTRALKHVDFSGWMIWPVTEAVSRTALTSGSVHDFDKGMELLAQLTPRLSSEFAVRDLLNARPARALERMTVWASDQNAHVRRLATEGSRAYLPWARRVPWLIENPRATRAILDATYRDPSEYVRRSAANHLNDLSRVDPAAVTSPDANTAWVIRHGLRTLLKRADPSALSLVGFVGSDLAVSTPELEEQKLPWGGSLAFSARISNHGTSEANVAIDYRIGFVRANGTIGEKVFKLAVRKVAPGHTVDISKKHSFREITTRTYYPGDHSVTIQANGVQSMPAPFVLESPISSEGDT